MAARLDEFRHIDMSLVAVSFRQTRKRMRGGLYASLTPLRFAGGQAQSVRRGRNWKIQRVVVDGREMLYLLNFYLPRFLDLPFAEKLTTIAHELLHVGPRFDGDLRRFGGRCYAHTHSHAEFDAHAARLAQRWLASGPDEDPLSFPAHGLPQAAVPARPHLRPPHRRAETASGRVKRRDGQDSTVNN